MLAVGRVAVPTHIQVFGIGDIDKDSLLLYFESSNASGGGDVHDIWLHPKVKCALVQFEDPNGTN
jgi:hypothetical protein